MRIYIDEAGSFVPPETSRPSFSLVIALIIPAEIEKDLFYEFLRLRDTWPNRDVEIKGSSLDELQAAQLVALVLRYDVLVDFVALDTNTHRGALIEGFKSRQADAVTANITREHHSGPILHLHKLGEAIRTMPNQLFLQAFATWHLIIETIREATLYYVQRRPQELGDIAWFIDRKDKTLTEMEDTWSTLVLPMSENAFATEPMVFIEEEDYSQFLDRYGFTEATVDPDMKQHVLWLRSICGDPIQTEDSEYAIDAKRLLTEQLMFQDSRESLGLQLSDMLAAILRRALNDRLELIGWKDFGSLLVRRRYVGDRFIQIGRGGNISMQGHAKKVCQALHDTAKDMVAERNRRTRSP